MEDWILLAPTGQWTFSPPSVGFRAGTPVNRRGPSLCRGSWEEWARRKEKNNGAHSIVWYWFCPSGPSGDLRKRNDLPTNGPRSQIPFSSEKEHILKYFLTWNLWSKFMLATLVTSRWMYQVCSADFLMPSLGFSGFLGWTYLRRLAGQGQDQQLWPQEIRGLWKASWPH